MNEFTAAMERFVAPLLGPLAPYLTHIIAALVLGFVLVRFALPWLGRTLVRLARRTPRAFYKAKQDLLAHERISEMYAPAQHYTRDLREKESRNQWAWLSYYPRAVRASIKRNNVPRDQKLDARAQIAAAAKSITVTAPHKLDNVAGDPDKHFRIDMRLDGHDEEEMKRLEGRIKAQLGLHSVERKDTSDNFSISLIAHKEAPVDILTERKAGTEFFEENPAKTPYSLPCALLADGSVFNLAMHHTLIDGMTGAGKSGPLHAIVRQLLPFWEQGRVEFYGIDPKMTELKAYKETPIFNEIVQDATDAQEVIAHVYHAMNERSRTAKIDMEAGDLKRNLDATKETPMVVLVIDEMLDLLLSLKGLGKSGGETISLLNGILAKGRSLGYYVVGATQALDTELLGRMRNNFANIILLRQESVHFNDLFLGEGARERGFDSTAIPASNKANGYAYAGIGYAKGEGGDPVKMRFAYTSDEDLIEIIKQYPRETESASGYSASMFD